jgi:hypothetical protein
MGATKRQRGDPIRIASLAAPATASQQPVRQEQHLGLRAVGVAVSNLAGPILAKRGGGILVRLKAQWPAIVGPDWSGLTWPRALGRDGLLKLNVIPLAAIELQHGGPLLIERINLFFGRPVITRLAFVQGGPVPGSLPASHLGPAPSRVLAAGKCDALDTRLSGIADPELRAALRRLGCAVIGTGRDTEG